MTCAVSTSCAELLLQILVIGISNGAVIALNAVGVTLVYGAVRMINFAYGDIFALSTVLVVVVVRELGLLPGVAALPLAVGLVLALAVAIGLGVALNLAVERVAFRPFRGSARLGPLIATVGISFMLYQAALSWRTADKSDPGAHHSVPGVPEVPRLGIPDLLPDVNVLHALGLPTSVIYTIKDLVVLLLAIGLALLVSWFLNRTRSGRALRAGAQDAEMAQLCGVNRDATIRLAFAIGGALAGASAFIFTIYYNHPFTEHGAESSLFAFTAAVLGGIGRPRGAFLSGLVLGVLAAFSDFFISSQWTPVVVLLVLIVLLALRPTGLNGEDRDEEQQAASGAVGERRLAGRARATIGLLGLALIYPVLDLALGLHLQLVAISILLFVLMALGLNIVLGFAGLLDLGYAACFALGGYTVAMLTGGPLYAYLPTRLDFLLVLGVSVLVAGIFGVLNGALATRLRGDYLAIVTVAFGLIIPRVFMNMDTWTGGSRGMSALPRPRLFGFSFTNINAAYYLVFVMVLLAAIGSHRLARSRIGRAWAALSEDEIAAASCGVDVVRSKHLAFVIGSIVAGIAGALFASIFSYVDPEQFDFRVSAMVLAMVVIGGAGSVPGAIVGAVLVAAYDLLLIPQLGVWIDQLRQLSGGGFTAFDVRALNAFYFGLALYLTVLFRVRRRPQSAQSLGDRFHEWRRLRALRARSAE
jgi:branched-chain amino acid transport system permease protein